MAIRPTTCSLLLLLLARCSRYSWVADVTGSVRTQQQHTPLLLAAAIGHGELCTLLLERHADVEHADADGVTALACGTWAAVKLSAPYFCTRTRPC